MLAKRQVTTCASVSHLNGKTTTFFTRELARVRSTGADVVSQADSDASMDLWGGPIHMDLLTGLLISLAKIVVAFKANTLSFIALYIYIYIYCIKPFVLDCSVLAYNKEADRQAEVKPF